jgi:hypothetical protein
LTYAYARSTWNNVQCTFGNIWTNANGDRRSFLGARNLSAVGGIPNDATDTYAPFRIESGVIQFGDWMRQRYGIGNPVVDCGTPLDGNNDEYFKWCWTFWIGDQVLGDTVDGVLVGTDTVYDNDVSKRELWDKVLFQVGHPTGTPAEQLMRARLNLTKWSSREYKKDISPLDAAGVSALLHDAMAVDVFRYRLKIDPPQRHLRIGLIAEEAPSEFSDGKMLSQTKAAAYLAGLMKALRQEQVHLSARLDELEERRAARLAEGKTP